MTAIIPLGRFERVALRDAWPTEDENFTPWLAHPDNIRLLGIALEIELEVEAVEHWVGPFRADILARANDESDDHRVVIENQFGRTNHGHLGQILTYLAGIEGARSVVWIAETIQPDHRAAIDWLNANTSEDFSFFAIEVELWRIGNSQVAPRFSVIASPNDWTRNAKEGTREVARGALTDLRRMRQDYWASLTEFLRNKKAGLQMRRLRTGPGYPFTTGRSGCVVSARLDVENKRIGVALILRTADRFIFHGLRDHKEVIEREIGEALDWQENSGGRKPRIAVYKRDADPADTGQWPEQHAWMLEKLERFRAAFVPRLKSLPFASSAEAEDDDEASED